MERIEKIFQKMTLKKALLMISGIVLALVTVLSALTILAADDIRQNILDTRTITVKDSGTMYRAGEAESGQPIYYEVNPGNYSYGRLSLKNQSFYYLTTFLMAALPGIYILIGAAAVVFMYYRIKLSSPIEALRTGIAHISESDLDFHISCDARDELGMLCRTFEDMRKELYQNNQRMWEMLRERKALTASVSHDLRTPITVIKGYLEYLESMRGRGQLSEETLVPVMRSMMESTERLERYVDCIRNIQRLEDVKLEKSTMSVSGLYAALKDEFSLLAGKWRREIIFYNDSKRDTVCTDRDMLFKILENLLNNAFRFSARCITFTVADDGDYLDFTVRDDGKGFDRDELECAASLFYSSDDGNENFGIGLFICKILCERLEGTLTLNNHEDGGASILAKIKIT